MSLARWFCLLPVAVSAIAGCSDEVPEEQGVVEALDGDIFDRDIGIPSPPDGNICTDGVDVGLWGTSCGSDTECGPGMFCRRADAGFGSCEVICHSLCDCPAPTFCGMGGYCENP